MSEGRQCPCTDIILAVDKFSDRVNLSACLVKGDWAFHTNQPKPAAYKWREFDSLKQVLGHMYIYIFKYQEYFSLVPKIW